MTNKKIRPTTQWEYLNNRLIQSKRTNLLLSFIILIFSILIGIKLMENPLVISTTDQGKIIYQSSRNEMKIDSLDLSSFVKVFINKRYAWQSFEPKRISRKIAPFVTKSFLKKVLTKFGKKALKNKEGQTVRQLVAGIDVEINDKEIVARFHRILEINNSPIASPELIKLSIKDGKKTLENPLGLYVNGVIEYVQ